MLLPGPDTRVVELRVHGIMGTRAESLVGAVSAVDVAGDGAGRIVRPGDRLNQPGPGPVLRADGRSVPRTVEGYVWGAMTSGGVAKSAWALLFPFALANVAHWMLPPVPGRGRVGAALGLVARALLRLAAMLLTVLFVTQVAVVSLDLVAGQCLAPGTPCLPGLVPEWLRGAPGVRAGIGLLPPLLVVLLLHRISAVNWRVHAPPSPSPVPGNRPQRMPGANIVADPDTPALRALHTVACLAALAVLPDGGRFPVEQRAAGATLFALCALGVLLLDDPTGATPHRTGRWLRATFGPATRRALLVLGSALVVATAAGLHPLPTAQLGTDRTVETVAAALIVVCVLFGLVVIPAALVARRTWADQPRELRPWAGGWMSPVLLATAGLLGGGFGAGVAITVRELVGRTDLDLPPGYEPITLLWGVTAAVAVVAGLLVAAVAGVHRRRAERAGRTPPEVEFLHGSVHPEQRAEAIRAWRRARFQRRHFHHLVLAFTAVLCGGAAVAIGMRVRGVDPPSWLGPFSTLGVAALGLLAAALLRAVFQAMREPEAARSLGVLADLACFWPREAHPIVPPCYALKVIPELAQRAVTHLAERSTRVVVAGHSHGSLIAVVAVSRLLETLPPEDRERVGLITAGSPLQWAYTRAFPGVVPHTSLAELHGLLEGRWHAMCRGTDPLGGAVTTWGRRAYSSQVLGVGFRVTGGSGPLPPAEISPTGALVLGSDHWLPDPLAGPLPGRRWSPGVRRHRDYLSDPEWDRAVALAAGLDPPAS